MDKRNKISFIPQKTISRSVQRSHRPVSLILVLSLVFFFITVFVYGGVFFYKNNLEKIVAGKQTQLSLAKKELDPNNTIENVQKFQKRIDNIKKLLGSHIAPSAIFGLLEDITLKSIKFDSYDFSSTEKDVKVSNQNNTIPSNTAPNKIKKKKVTSFSIMLKGSAPNYASLAYQADIIREEIKKNKRIADFTISDISLDLKGNILFTLRMTVLPSFISYRNMVNPSNEISTSTSTSTLDNLNNNKNSKTVVNGK